MSNQKNGVRTRQAKAWMKRLPGLLSRTASWVMHCVGCQLSRLLSRLIGSIRRSGKHLDLLIDALNLLQDFALTVSAIVQLVS